MLIALLVLVLNNVLNDDFSAKNAFAQRMYLTNIKTSLDKLLSTKEPDLKCDFQPAKPVKKVSA